MNNIFYNNFAGWGVHIYGGFASNVNIIGNTFAFPNPHRDGQIIIAEPTFNLFIAGNIFYKPANSAIRADSCRKSVNLILENNLTTAGSFDSDCRFLSSSNNLTNTDPLFVAPGSYDFHLRPGSPAIKAGLVWPGRVHDAYGNPLGSPPDAGGVAFQASPRQLKKTPRRHNKATVKPSGASGETWGEMVRTKMRELIRAIGE